MSRRGKITLECSLCQGYDEVVSQIMRELKFVPLDMSQSLISKKFTYDGLSYRFDNLRDDEPVPEYRLTPSIDEYGHFILEAKRL